MNLRRRDCACGPWPRKTLFPLYEIYADNEAMRYWSNRPVTDVSGSQKLTDEDVKAQADGYCAFWAIEHKEDNRVIGKLTLFNYSEQNRRAEIGYLLHPGYWRGGLATEACTALLDLCFGALDLHRMEADADVDNAPSIGLLEKLGFQREGLFPQRWNVYGEWQDSLMLGLLRPDWLKRRG